MAKFENETNFAPVQHIDTDTSGGHGGESNSVALGYNTANAGDGGYAVGGDADGGDGTGLGVGGSSGDADADARGGHDFWPWGGDDADAKAKSGDGGDGVGVGVGGHGGTGGDADAGGGDALNYGYTTANSSADGGDGGDANVYATQNNTLVQDYDFNNSFNEYNETTIVRDSYNQDNDGVDNQGGIINNSVVAGDDIEDSFTDDDVVIEDSFKVDNSQHHIDASHDDNSFTHINDSFKSDDDLLDLDLSNIDVDLL